MWQIFMVKIGRRTTLKIDKYRMVIVKRMIDRATLFSNNFAKKNLNFLNGRTVYLKLT